MTPKLTPREQLLHDRLERIEDQLHRLMKGLNELAGYTLTTATRQGGIATNVDLITRAILAGRPDADSQDAALNKPEGVPES